MRVLPRARESLAPRKAVRALHDDGGNVVADLDHDSYGNPQATVESVVQPYRFTGREYDKDTGLYQYRAREYDPVTGRFLQEDPIWFDSGDMNVYRYTWNNPVMWTDPSGQSPLIEYACLASFGAGAGATTGAAAGLDPGAIFTTISKVLAVITGNEDRLPEIDAQWNRAQTAVLATVAAIDAAGLACGRAKAKKQKPKSCRELSKPNSFSGETVVFTERGLEPIAELKVGDKVAAWNPATGKHDWKPITARSERTATSGLVRLTLEDASGHTESLSTTANHPFLRAVDAANDNPPEAQGPLVPMEPAGLWTSAGKLQPGDLIRAADGRSLSVVQVTPGGDLARSDERVYSLEVEDLQSFAVGNLGSWSHNWRHRPPAGQLSGATQDPKLPKHIRGWYCAQSRKRPPSNWKNPPGYDWGKNWIDCTCPPRLELSRDNRSRGGRSKR